MLLDLYNLRRNMWLKPEELAKAQIKKLKEILQYTYDYVPFYHAKFRSAGLRPNDVKTFEDMAKIPLTTKKEIQAAPFNQVVARNVDISKCVTNKTSGSTGIPLVTIAGERTKNFDDAAWLRAFFENGLRIRDRRLIIANPGLHDFSSRSWSQRLGMIRKEYISVFEDDKRKYALISEEEPDVIESYPSSLTILADFCRSQSYTLETRLIFTFAELLDQNARKLIKSVSDAELFDYYGASEFSLMAWECKAHSGYHLNSDGCLMEFLNNGESVASGERGRIVCTTLVNHEMPLIRYDVGDVGIPMEERCTCGKTLPMMKMVEGRVDDFLTALDGRIISPTVFFPYPFKDFVEIRQMRVIQEKRDEIKIQLVTTGNALAEEVLWEAKKEIRRVFGQDMQVEFEFLNEFDKDSSGKLKMIESRVPVTFG